MQTQLEREALGALRSLEHTIHRARSNDSGTARWDRTRRDTDAALNLIERYRLKNAARVPEEQQTGGAGWASFVPVDVDQAVGVLAGADHVDDNGCSADYWIKKAEEADFFNDMPMSAKKELMRIAAAVKGGHLHAHLRDCIRAAIGE